MKNPKVLILGKNGMTGRMLFNYLKMNHNNIFGTTRNDGYLKLNAKNVSLDLPKVLDKIGEVDFIVNCIGLNKVTDDNKQEAIYTNSLLPIELGRLSKIYKFRVIHISTDAVFERLSGKVSEKDIPTPIGLYAITKYLGENKSENLLNIRTSLIGTSPLKKTGLIESILSSNLIEGYSNQIWSGCTTLQFAQFCEDLIYNNGFSSFRRKNYILHFAPLDHVTKFDLISEIIKQSGKKIKLKNVTSKTKINRYLSSLFLTKKDLKEYDTNLSTTIERLFKFNYE